MTRYLLWDQDGVLVDTEPLYYEATREELAALGVELRLETYLELMAAGRSAWELAESRGADRETVERHRARRNDRYYRCLETHPIEIEGVEEALGLLATRCRMAIVTTALRPAFERIHRGRRLLERMEFALTREDYERAKPEPDPYLAALARFGASAEEALAIEDSARGLQSALRAGLRCVIVRNRFTASHDFTGAWRILDSIRELPGVLRP